MSKMQRTKGAAGERELCGLLYNELGVQMVRNLEQSRSGGHDIIPSPLCAGEAVDFLARLAIEVKRRAAVSMADLRGWWDQAEEQAAIAGLVPCLAYRADRQAWRFVLPLSALSSGMTRAPGIGFTADLSLPAFCAVVREGVLGRCPRTYTLMEVGMRKARPVSRSGLGGLRGGASIYAGKS